MESYRVEITDAALRDVEEYVRYIREVNHEPEAAERWFRGVVAAIYSLERHPRRCPEIPERRHLPGIRHLLYHSHRIVFGIAAGVGKRGQGAVTVYRIYPGAKLPLRGLADLG